MEHKSPGQNFTGKDKCVRDVFQPHGELSTASLAQALEVFRFGSPTEIFLGVLWALSVVVCVGHTQGSTLLCGLE